MLTRRAGFTIIELLIVMILLSLVGGAIVTLLLRQQRFYSSTQAVIDTRAQIRQAAAMLPSDLRGISSPGGDLYVMTDSAIEFRSVFGMSTVCVVTAGKSPSINVVPLKLSSGAVLTSWSMTPTVNDSVAIYDNGAGTASTDDQWRLYGITTVNALAGSSTTCPTSTGLVQTADQASSNTVYQYVLSPTQSTTLAVGAAMRFFRRVHYSLYKAADNNWYLGYYDCKAGRSPVCNAIQAVAGPFKAYATDNTSGLQFSYYDSTGAVTATPSLVARISVVARGQSSSLVNLSGAGGKIFGDSIRIEVGLRNRK